MSTTILPSVANTIKVNIGYGTGIWLDKFTNAIHNYRTRDSKNVVVIEDVSFVDQDITLPVVALDDKRVFYTFGKNFGGLVLTGSIFFGCGEVSMFPAMSTIQDTFDEIRVSSSKEPLTLSIVGGFSCKVYVQQLEFMQAMPAFQSIKFRISCTVVPPSNKG